MNRSKRERLVGLDVMRIVLALFVFLFHSRMHGADYKVLNPIVSKGMAFMTAFFMLSGFALYHSQGQELNDWISVKTFYKKRVLSIMPAYWAIAIIHPIWNWCSGSGGARNAIILFPIELLGLQSVFHSISSVGHNGGTWFVSCLIFCYVLFPLFCRVLQNITSRQRKALMIIVVGVLLYAPLIAKFFETEDIYANVFFRVLEFILGMLIAFYWEQMENKKSDVKKYRNEIGSACVLLGVLIALFVADKFPSVFSTYSMYNMISIPLFGILLYFCAGINGGLVAKSKVVQYCVKASYAFFFAQFFTWKYTEVFLQFLGTDKNIIRIMTSVIICVGFTILLCELIEKPIRKILNQILFGN